MHFSCLLRVPRIPVICCFLIWYPSDKNYARQRPSVCVLRCTIYTKQSWRKQEPHDWCHLEDYRQPYRIQKHKDSFHDHIYPLLNGLMQHRDVWHTAHKKLEPGAQAPSVRRRQRTLPLSRHATCWCAPGKTYACLCGRANMCVCECVWLIWAHLRTSTQVLEYAHTFTHAHNIHQLAIKLN